MTSTTWPSGLEHRVITVSPRERPLHRSVRSVQPEPVMHDVERRLRPSHIAVWCIAGSLGWAAAIGGGLLASSLLSHLF